MMVLLLVLPSCQRGNESPPVPEITRGEQLPNIILLTVDTLRADHMALYGYPRDTMPAIEAFAQTAVVFDNAVVPRGTTGPSYASMLTGLYPFRHGVRTNMTMLHEDLTVLPEILKSKGYHTAGFVSNSVLLAEVSGFGQGFDVYDDRLDEREANRFNYERTAHNTLQAILEWLASDPPQPFLLFTNFIDPHGPYLPPERFGKMYQSNKVRLLPKNQIPRYQLVEGQFNYYDYVDRYDGEIRYTDEALGALIEALRRKGLWDEAFVVFTADHGESFGEHGWRCFEHRFGVWETTMHVPMAIRLPGSTARQAGVWPRRVGSVCSPMDLTPTILACTGLSADVEFDGRSLRPLLEGTETTDRMLLLEWPDIATPARSLPDYYAVRSATHKLMRALDPHTGRMLGQQVYSLAEDPLEGRAIRVDQSDPVHRKLATELDSMLQRVGSYKIPFTRTEFRLPWLVDADVARQKQRAEGTTAKKLTTQQAQRLRSLGYVE